MKAQNMQQAENQVIINEYRSMMRAITDRANTEEKKNIRKAFNLAIDAHKNSRRKSGKP